jgi:hypothetical protein
MYKAQNLWYLKYNIPLTIHINMFYININLYIALSK